MNRACSTRLGCTEYSYLDYTKKKNRVGYGLDHAYSNHKNMAENVRILIFIKLFCLDTVFNFCVFVYIQEFTSKSKF